MGARKKNLLQNRRTFHCNKSQNLILVMASLEHSHHYLRLRPVKMLSKLYLKNRASFSPS